MSKKIIVCAFDIVAGPLCVSAEDGQAVHDKIASLLHEGEKVDLSFKGIETLIPAFLNTAIGQLYDEFSEERICELLSISHITQEDSNLLKHVLDNAKAYCKNPVQFDMAWQEEINCENER